MEPFANAKDKTLFWAQPAALSRSYTLHAGEHQYASLEFRSSAGSLAHGRVEGDGWSFKRLGFFKTRITVRCLGEETDLAEFHPRWTGTEGALLFPGGNSLVWRSANFWATRFTWVDSNGADLVVYSPGVEEHHFSDVFKHQSQVSITPAGWELDEIPVLVILGWYLMILHQEDVAATAAVAASY